MHVNQSADLILFRHGCSNLKCVNSFSLRKRVVLFWGNFEILKEYWLRQGRANIFPFGWRGELVFRSEANRLKQDLFLSDKLYFPDFCLR